MVSLLQTLLIIGSKVAADLSSTKCKEILCGLDEMSIIPKTLISLLVCLPWWYFCLCQKRLSLISTIACSPPSETGFAKQCISHAVLRKSTKRSIDREEARTSKPICTCVWLSNHFQVILLYQLTIY
ncbi:hypothetical protein EHP00_2510 [Ecytonucleospora hepatopenaei]|uniref:Uncharacterized protein n=1 Tax=Ecytonucleospora hepatopenaei TaxID=646526 RepID=A0A1W0E7M1_9MICR|nr:hypothetical protein EHP00_2510 [Ecytonucleospora hepatopenaei]